MSESKHGSALVKSKTESQRFLTFALGQESYAVPLAKVREVIALGEITKVPNTPPHFKGIMNLRGQVISVVDLRVKFKMKDISTTPESAIIILDLNPLCLGIIIDSVEAVLPVNEENMSPPPDIETGINTDYIKGIARVDKRLLLILDIEKTLSVEDLVAMKNQDSRKNAA